MVSSNDAAFRAVYLLFFYTRLERRNVNRSSQESVKEKETVVSSILFSQTDLGVVQLKVVPGCYEVSTTWEQWKRVIWRDEEEKRKEWKRRVKENKKQIRPLKPRTGPAFNNGLYAVESRRLLEKEEDSGFHHYIQKTERKEKSVSKEFSDCDHTILNLSVKEKVEGIQLKSKSIAFNFSYWLTMDHIIESECEEISGQIKKVNPTVKLVKEWQNGEKLKKNLKILDLNMSAKQDSAFKIIDKFDEVKKFTDLEKQISSGEVRKIRKATDGKIAVLSVNKDKLLLKSFGNCQEDFERGIR